MMTDNTGNEPIPSQEGDNTYDVNADVRETPETEENDGGLMTLANLKVAQTNILGGLLTGYSIGYVAVYSTLYDISNTCSSFYSKESCETLSNVKCEWITEYDETFCAWKDQPHCKQLYSSDEEKCSSTDHCVWSYSDKNCDNVHGYSAVYSGVFAGALVLGCMIGGMCGGMISNKLGPKRSFVMVGIVSLICSAMYHISAGLNQFWVLVVARVIIGFMAGICCVAGPTYVTINAKPKYSKSIGVLYQIFVTFGIFFASIIGLAVGQSVKYDGGDQHLMARMQAIAACNTLISLMVLVFLGILLPPGKDEWGKSNDDSAANTANQKQYSWFSMLMPLFLGVVVSGTSQMTGVNAVMNYAPTMMDSLGMQPLVGNLIVMGINFIMTLGSIPLAAYFPMRTMFLWGSAVCSLSCLLLCGVPVYPGVASKNVKDGVAITGILIFITAFELSVGPCFYVFSQDLYPASFRSKGASWMMFVQFFFNLIINVMYPIATKAISGGASGDQNKGQAVAFMFFGGIGVVCFIIQYFFLYPWEDKETTTPNGPIGDDDVESEIDGGDEADAMVEAQAAAAKSEEDNRENSW